MKASNFGSNDLQTICQKSLLFSLNQIGRVIKFLFPQAHNILSRNTNVNSHSKLFLKWIATFKALQGLQLFVNINSPIIHSRLNLGLQKVVNKPVKCKLNFHYKINSLFY